MAKLSDYRRKRSPEATNEPFGDDARESSKGTLSGAFVVHLHDATRLHYDVRLEIGGVLSSFAVPHGPSLDPEAKHLAVNTEDHPIEYLEFEDVIPPKQYGAGPMIVWDRGQVEYLEGPAEDEKASGKLHVRLRGMKLRGAFAFVKLAKSAKGNEWLFFKKNDEHASKKRSITEELPRSVLSGLRIDELERAAEIGEALVARAFAAGAARLADAHAIAALVAAGSGKVGRDVVFDPELDGLRVLASRDGDVVSIRLFAPHAPPQAIESFYPEVVRALRSLPASRVVLDGTLVAWSDTGHPSLSLLARRASRFTKGQGARAAVETPVVLVATDLLALGDADTRTMKLEVRRTLLSALLPELGFVRTTAPLEGALEPLLAFAAEHDIPGMIAKKKSAPYDPAKAGWIFVPSGIAPRSRATVDHEAPDARAALRKVSITNRQKIFWPDDGYTKGDLIDFYAHVADVILPHIAERPLILVRYPDGIAGKSFFQWNVPPGMPPWVRTMLFREHEDGHRKRGFLVDDASTLLYIANLGCIPLHILASRVPDLDRADFATIDFDVKQSELRHAITLAKTLRGILEDIELPGFAKTSGQTGLHVLVPLGPNQSFETARALAELLGKMLVDKYPALATMERMVGKRGSRVYVDTGQTGTTRAIVAPYSVRATPGATVSTPLAWEEVNSRLDPRAFTIKTVPARIAKKGDLMKGLVGATPNIPRAIARLGDLVPRSVQPSRVPGDD